MMSHTVSLTFKKPPPHSAGCHTQTECFLRCLQTHGGTMEMQMCPFLFFPSKVLRAYCQGIQLVCHRYSARGGEAATRRSLWGHTRQTGIGCTKEQDTVNMADPVWLPVHLSRSGSEAKRGLSATLWVVLQANISKTPLLSCLFTKRESITQPEQPATADQIL